MSSISFPHSGGAGHRHSSSTSPHDHDEHDFQPSFHHPSFDSTDGSMAFQVNPHSLRPPRSPHTSTASNSQVYGRDIYNDTGSDEKREKESDDEQSESGKAVEEAKKRVTVGEIWKEVFTSSGGRDKTFKLMQYSIRLFLLMHATSSAYRFKRADWETSMVKRLESTTSGFGMTRNLLNLFEWLGPMTSILSQHHEDPYPLEKAVKKPAKTTPLLYTFLHAPPPVLLEFVNCLADDIYTFSRLGLIGQRLGDRAARFSDWCWFTSILVDLVENGVERGVLMDLQRQVESRLYADSMTGATSKSNPTANKVDEKELARLKRQDFWIKMTRMKLVMDLIFVSYDVFRIKRAKGPVQTLTGLISAIISTTKLYETHKTALSKALAR